MNTVQHFLRPRPSAPQLGRIPQMRTSATAPIRTPNHVYTLPYHSPGIGDFPTHPRPGRHPSLCSGLHRRKPKACSKRPPAMGSPGRRPSDVSATFGVGDTLSVLAAHYVSYSAIEGKAKEGLGYGLGNVRDTSYVPLDSLAGSPSYSSLLAYRGEGRGHRENTQWHRYVLP